eukprot:433546-Prorocentrum_minimum.AAC.3
MDPLALWIHPMALWITGRADERHGPGLAAFCVGADSQVPQRAHHHPHHTLHGRGGHARRPRRHHVCGQARVRGVAAVSQKPVRVGLPPYGGQGGRRPATC